MKTVKMRASAIIVMRRYRRIPDFIDKMKTISLNIANDINGYFGTPVPTVVNVNLHIVTLDTAQTVAGTRVPGSVAERNIALVVVQDDMRAWLRYAQDLADAAPDVETAISIIESAGFEVKVNGRFQKPRLQASNGRVSGEVKLTAGRDKVRGSSEWAKSMDNGATWVALAPSQQAKTYVDGFAPADIVAFRQRFISKSGPTSWSNAITWVVQ